VNSDRTSHVYIIHLYETLFNIITNETAGAEKLQQRRSQTTVNYATLFTKLDECANPYLKNQLLFVKHNGIKTLNTQLLVPCNKFVVLDRRRLVLGVFAKLWKATFSFVMSVCLSVCPHGTNRLLLEGFSWNMIFQYFSKMCRENSSFIKIWQE